MHASTNGWVFVTTIAVAASVLLGAEPKPASPAPPAAPGAPSAPGPPSAEQVASMEADFKAHMDKLGALAGNWTITRRDFTAGDGVPMWQEGTFDTSWTLDRHYLQIDFDMQIKGREQPRRVLWRGMFTYDPAQKTHVTTWLGTRGRRFTETGDWDSTGRVLTLTSFQEDATTKESKRVVSVFTLKEDGSLRVEDTTFEEGGPAEGTQTLLLECVRR